MSDIKKVFINNLIYYRNLAKLSQQELSTKINASYNYINSLENNNLTPSLDKIELIAKTLKVKPSDLLSEKGCPKNYVIFNKKEFVSALAQQVKENTNASLEENIKKIIKDY